MSGVMLVWFSICSEFTGIHELAPDCDQHSVSKVLNNRIMIQRTHPLHHIKQPLLAYAIHILHYAQGYGPMEITVTLLHSAQKYK
jgi:hypothetical protein